MTNLCPDAGHWCIDRPTMKYVLLLSIFVALTLLAGAQCNLLPNAIPGITLVHQNTNCNNNSGVAFNPNLNLYYGVRAGNSAFPLETWSVTGTPLYNTTAGFDWRGMWWNPITNQLEGNGYNTMGMWRADLNGSGYALNTGYNIFTGLNQPDAQSCGDLDCDAYEVLYYSNGSIYRYSRTTNAFLGSYPITGTPVAISNLNSTTVMYTGCPGKEIALLDYNNKRVYVYNKANGAYAGMSQLPASAVTTSAFRTSWANCYVWLFNLANYTWYSYKIFDACVVGCGCPPVFTNFSHSICSGDSIFLAGAWHSAPGAYNDTLTAASGCDSILVHNLTVIQPVVVNTAMAICTGDSVLLGGAWRHLAGVYHDTLVAASGCDSVRNTTLSLIPLSTGTQNLAICIGDSVFVGGAWQHQSGVYHDTLTAVSGCDSIGTSILTVIPVAYGTQTKSICSGDSMLLGGAWRKIPGIYVDTLTAASGCDSVRTTTLIVNPVYNQTKTAEICQGDKIFLGGQWQTIAGIYIDHYTTVKGCDSLVSTILVVNPLPVVDLGSDQVLCEGDTYVLDATTPNVTYLWSDFSTGPTLTVTQTGTYSVEVDLNHCKDRDTVNVTFNIVPIIDLGPDQSLCPDRSVVLNATTSNATYLWQDNTKKPLYTVSQNGTYWVAVTIANCTGTDTVHIDFDNPDCACPVFIPNAFSPNNDMNNDELRLVNTLGVDLKDFRIYNRWGEEVFKTTGLFDSWNGNYKGQPADMGSYFYFVRYVCRYNGREYVLKGDITLIR